MTATTPTLGKDRPIIFSAPMVRALLHGRKTQTRRILKLPRWASTDPDHIEFGASGAPEVICQDTGCLAVLPLPYAVGDRLWVREAWRAPAMNDDVAPRDLGVGMTRAFEVDDEQLVGTGHDAVRCPIGAAGKLRPSIFMPRWASRLTLAVTDVRVERLSDISEADAIAEGLKPDACAGQRMWDPGTPHGLFGDPRVAFRMLWDSIHGLNAWAENPWVAAITFTVHHANIDALQPAPVGAGRSV